MSVTDSVILSKILDGTIIVTKAGKTTYEIASRGLKYLSGRRESDVEFRILGIVINFFNLKKSDHYYYQYYQYSPYAEKDSKKST
jgi:succinoglycan biosynthesis transport protein ExoP